MKTLSTFVRGWKKLCESGYRFYAAQGGDIREIRSGGLTNRLRGSLHNRAEPSRAEPSRAEPSRAEPSRAEPPLLRLRSAAA